MVTSAEQRIATATAKQDPIVYYLRLKALLRINGYQPALIETVKTEKDNAIKPIIDSANLNIAEKLNAWQAWRELYYMYYTALQHVQKIVV